MTQNKNNNTDKNYYKDFSEDLKQQIVNISKAQGFDIVSEQVKELKAANEILTNALMELRSRYEKSVWITDVIDTAINNAKKLKQ